MGGKKLVTSRVKKWTMTIKKSVKEIRRGVKKGTGMRTNFGWPVEI
jgi:hypothetical protein